MKEPVVAADGHTYERSAIETWLAENATSPITREPISSNMLIPNFSIKSQIAALAPSQLDGTNASEGYQGVT